MGQKNDMKSRKERFANNNRERKRVQKMEESKGSNAMIYWLVAAFIAVAILIGFLVWQASSEGKQTQEPTPTQETNNNQQTTPTQETNNNQQTNEPDKMIETKETDQSQPADANKVTSSNQDSPTTSTIDNKKNLNQSTNQANSSNSTANPNEEETVKANTKKPALPISNKPNPKKKLVNGLPKYDYAPPLKIDTTKDYKALLKTNKGDMLLELYANEAPLAVNNFIFLARDKYYDGVKFHRIIKDFMVQTGDPEGTGGGGPGYSFNDEFSFEYEYEKGVVAMANAGPNTNGSQFFIGTGKDVEFLEETRAYTIFGKVIDGYDVLSKIAATPVTENPQGEKSSPLEEIVIQSIEIREPK